MGSGMPLVDELGNQTAAHAGWAPTDRIPTRSRWALPVGPATSTARRRVVGGSCQSENQSPASDRKEGSASFRACDISATWTHAAGNAAGSRRTAALDAASSDPSPS